MLLRSLRPVVTCLAVLVLVLGCTRALPHAAGTPDRGGLAMGPSSQTLSFGGVDRSFDVYRPAGLDEPAPLVVMLHGGFGNGAQAERAYHWDAEADRGHFVVAYPDGIDRAWNAGSCCGVPAKTGVDDVGFVSAVVATIAQQVPIDPNRVYATGMSNGAMLTLRLGCETTVFAAIAPVAGTLLADCSRAQPTSVLQIHGTADDRVPYDGGPGKATTGSGTPRVDGPSVPAVNATWRAIDGCAAPTTTDTPPVTTQTASCPGGQTVELISVDGAGHQWPGGVPSPLVQRLGNLPPPSNALDATDTIWQFFAGHHR